MVDFRGSGIRKWDRPSRFLADCNGVAADRNKSSRISGIVPGVGRRYAYRRRISLPFGIHIDRLSPMLRLARAVEGINSCLVAKRLPILKHQVPSSARMTGNPEIDVIHRIDRKYRRCVMSLKVIGAIDGQFLGQRLWGRALSSGGAPSGCLQNHTLIQTEPHHPRYPQPGSRISCTGSGMPS